MIKRFFILGLASVVAFSCAKSNTAVVSATVEGGAQKEIVVSQLAVNQIKAVDTVKADGKGAVKSVVTIASGSPEFYYLTYNGKRIASLVLKPGDKVSVKTDTLGKGIVIEGSQESQVLQQYEESLAAATASFDALAIQLSEAVNAGDSKLAEQLNAELGKVYVKYKQSLIKDIMTNPYAFANVQALHQSLMPGMPVFSDANDYLLVKRVHDSLAVMYPIYVYVKALAEQVKAAENTNEFITKLSEAKETSFPNISLPDINAKEVELASLEGKPFILMFWSITDANQKMFNNDLKDIYKKYKSAGLEIYQVSVDADKTAWATAVKEQNLPWISVCDGKGAASVAVASYNVYKVPTIYVFNRKGDIVAKDVYTEASLENAVKQAIR